MRTYTGTAAAGTWDRIDDNGMAGGISIFGVDPNNPNRLYASNLALAGPQMMFSTDGGQTWQNDAELDNMMTGGGAFLYQTQRGPNNFTGLNGYPQPTMVEWDEENGNNIVAGGRDPASS